MADEIFELKGKVSIDTKSLDSAINKLKTTLDKFTGMTTKNVEKTRKVLGEMVSVAEGSKTAAQALEDLGDATEDTGDKTEEAGKQAKKSASSFQKFWGQLKRIAVYRAIRSVLKAISSAIKEGTNNLYEFAKLTGSGTFAKAMDSITTNMSYIKNSLGTALAPVITAFAPVIESLANAFADLAERVARFFALLNGQNGYYRAIKNAKEYQKIQRQLLGFDELNVLNGNSSDNSTAFEWVEGFGELGFFELGIKQLGIFIEDIVPENISPLVIGGVLVSALLGTAGIFKAVGGLAGLDFSLSGIASMFGIDNVLTGGIDTTSVGNSVLSQVKGNSGMFSLEGGLDFLNMGLYGLSFVMGISSIIALANANSIETDDFWKAMKKLAWSSGTFMGLLIGSMAGMSAIGVSAMAITLGVTLTLLVQKARMDIESGAYEEYKNTASALASKLTSNDALTRIGAIVEMTNVVEDGGMDFYTNQKANKSNISLRANGGVVNTGELFIAGESGPELVSSIGGRTQVFNDTQLIGELSVANEGVINAIIQAASQVVSSVNNIPQPNIRIGDRDIYNANIRGQRLVGKNLVEGV